MKKGPEQISSTSARRGSAYTFKDSEWALQKSFNNRSNLEKSKNQI